MTANNTPVTSDAPTNNITNNMSRNEKYETSKREAGLRKVTLWIRADTVAQVANLVRQLNKTPELEVGPSALRNKTTGKFTKTNI